MTKKLTLGEKLSKPTKYKKIKIEFSNFDNSLTEIYQSTQMQFAFVTSDFKQCHDWVLCRDFLHDAVRTQYTGKESRIYGFKYDTSHPPINLNDVCIAVRNNNSKITNEQFKKQTESALHLVNFYEEMADVKKSKLFEVEVEESSKSVWLFVGPNMWLSAPQLVSMYTFLLRLGNKEMKFKTGSDLIDDFKKTIDTNKSQDNDTKYLKDCWDKLNLIIKNRKSLFEGIDFNSYKEQEINIFHNCGGIWSLCSFNANNPTLNERLRSLYEAEKNE